MSAKVKRTGGALSAILKLIVSSAVVFAIFYVFLPPLNPLATEFWIFLTAAIAIYLLPFGLAGIFKVYTLPGSSARVEFSPKTKTLAYKLMVVLVLIPVAVMIIGGVVLGVTERKRAPEGEQPPQALPREAAEE